MLTEFYKKIDRSMMEWGVTIKKKHWDAFQAEKPLKLGTSRKVTIVWGDKR